ncbi:MAG: ClpXP protease specificity-enhancing factor [Burkholderiales bacterium]|nr:ClpXP protease specificity-enhancing factor [Burkholderiales bacterium]
MTQVSTTEIPGSSTRPYLIRALHDWCTDNGFTPYLAVHVDRSVQVPMEYVKNNEIVLNVGFEATSGLKLGNDFIEFRARFGGMARDILVPVDHVVAIYARENGQGMAFPMPTAESEAPAATSAPVSHSVAPAPEAPRGLRLAPATPPAADEAGHTPEDDDGGEPPESPAPAPGGARPALKRIK